MKKLAIIFFLFAFPAHSQQVNDLVQEWLSEHSISATDYRTCDPAPSNAQVVGTDGVCSWGSDLGAQPTSSQLQALAPTWRTKQTAITNAQAAQARYNAAIAAGVAIASAAAPALTGTYALDDTTETHVDSEMVSILKNSTFTNGQTSRIWPTLGNASAPTFTTAQFMALAVAMGAYKDALIAAETGQGAWPATNTATIP